MDIDLAILDSSPRLNYKLSPASWESIAKELEHEDGSIAKAMSFDDVSPNKDSTSSPGKSGVDSGTDESPSKRHKAS